MTSPECITWMTVGLAESVAIVTLNLCTIIVFTRNRNLCNRSTYLVINLAVTDMLVGGVAVYYLFYLFGVFCNVWRGHPNEHLARYIDIILICFPGMSLINITIIALERAYATFRPFKHRVLKKRVYGLLIVFVWVITALSSFLGLKYFVEGVTGLYLTIAFSSFELLIICVSYSSIVIKVRCGAHPQHHGAASRERKLTMTLLIVTVSSLLFLPAFFFSILLDSGKFKIPFSVEINIHGALWVSLGANSLVNPILYAIRMPEYRSTLAALFRKKPTLRNRERRVVDLPLRDL
ncbi:histamine H2 receptor-like [Montipora capricornis]|uniref:histamine H2 receptor-like n=1 Tax=Montipora capricornis TaxID=246305 RepID=UPI0035F134D5